MSYKLFYQDIKDKNYKSLYLLYGSEKLMIDRLSKTFINQLLDKNQQAFNFIERSGDNLDYDEAIHIVCRLPIMASKQIFMIKGAEFLLGSQWSDKEKEYFINAHKENQDTITLIIADEIDKRKKAIKTASKIASIIEFSKLEDNELIKWCIKEVHNKNKKLSTQVAKRLVEGLGYNHKDSKLTLYGMLSILDKLCSSVNDEEIRLEDVEKIVDDNLDSNIFKMVDGVFNGEGEYVFRQLDALLKAGEVPIKIHFMLHRHLRLLLQVEHLKAENYSKQSIANKLNLKSFVVNNLYQQLSFWTRQDLMYLLNAAEKCDLALKSAVDPIYALENFLANSILLCKKIKSTR